MDFIMDLSFNVKLKVKILLVITDRLSKGVILIPMLSIFAPAVATAFIKRYVPYHGFPKAIISDRGPNLPAPCGPLYVKPWESSAASLRRTTRK